MKVRIDSNVCMEAFLLSTCSTCSTCVKGAVLEVKEEGLNEVIHCMKRKVNPCRKKEGHTEYDNVAVQSCSLQLTGCEEYFLW